MRFTPQTAIPNSEATTCYGGENIAGFRVVKVVSSARSAKGNKKAPRTLAEANKWLLANAAKVDARAAASTKRLIGRESV